jgi:ENTS family enterobactin (siderophore) exporter
VWTAQVLSGFGDVLTTAGLALTSYSSHSTWQVGAVFGARALPALLFGLSAGELIDRMERKRLMIAMDIARFGLVASLVLLVHMGFVAILAVAFLSALAAAVFNPARTAVVPDLVLPEMLPRANSLTALAERGTEVVGFAAAGVLLLSASVGVLFAVDALTFAVSAALLAGIHLAPNRGADGPGRSEAVRRVREGLAFIRRHRELRVILLVNMPVVAAGSALAPLTVPLAIDHLRAGSGGFALLEAGLGAGATAFALTFGVRRLRVTLGSALLAIGLMGVATVMTGITGDLGVTLALFAIIGAANVAYVICVKTLLQRLVPSNLRGRVVGAWVASTQFSVLLGTVGASSLVSLSQLNRSGSPLIATGACLLAIGAAAWAWSSRSLNPTPG